MSNQIDSIIAQIREAEADPHSPLLALADAYERLKGDCEAWRRLAHDRTQQWNELRDVQAERDEALATMRKVAQERQDALAEFRLARNRADALGEMLTAVENAAGCSVESPSLVQTITDLTAERDREHDARLLLERTNQTVAAERDRLREERDVMHEELAESLKTIRDRAALAGHADGLVKQAEKERDDLKIQLEWFDGVVSDRNALRAERDKLADKAELFDARNEILTNERNQFAEARDDLTKENAVLRAHRHEHTWTCACGWRNGVNLSQCAACNRAPGVDNPCTQDEGCIHESERNALRAEVADRCARVMELEAENVKLSAVSEKQSRELAALRAENATLLAERDKLFNKLADAHRVF